MQGSAPLKRVFVVSDSTGETAERLVRAVLLQFARSEIEVVVFPRVRKIADVTEIVVRAGREAALIVYTLVDPLVRERMVSLAEENNVETVDPIGQLMARLASVLGTAPSGTPGIMPSLDEDYFRRIEAVEFSVKHDDGQLPQGLARADIVMVGLSRTSKTPLSTFLAQRGYKVANVPVVLGIPLPRELDEIPQHKIYGLIIDLASLVRIRRARLKQLNMPLDSDYGMREHILKELKYAREIFRNHPAWPVLDVSQKAIEETASIIFWIKRERERRGLTEELMRGEPDGFGGFYDG
ncbi:MAG: kinase/pyrophosphorylase [Myxococcales bacterium]|nr:kinase/pyrophosphorylase [Myxococcales bacterium]